MTLATSPNPCVLGSPQTLTANVSVPPPGSGTPTGTVSFFDGTTLLGTSPVNGGVAGLALFAPSLGTRTLSAVYSGDGKFLGNSAPSQTDFVVSTAHPTVTSVSDVPSDHGRQVRLRFNASPFDFLGSATPITGYEVYRKSSTAPFAVSGLEHTEQPSPALNGWDYLVTAPAHGESIYQVDAATVADSSGLGLNRAIYFIRAATANPASFYDSAPDSGYSVDNLALSIPAPFTAAYVSGATHLHWGANTESDFWYYNLYRGSSASFVPSAANRIASQADTGYVDVGPAGSYYKLAAANLSGIESAYALVTPATTVGVESSGLPTTVFLSAPRPNPARGMASFAFGLPTDADVSVRIYQADGKLVRDLAHGSVTAGEHPLDWDLRDGAGVPVEAGLYFVRLRAAGATRTQRIAVVR
jgi:hypothetical protein